MRPKNFETLETASARSKIYRNLYNKKCIPNDNLNLFPRQFFLEMWELSHKELHFSTLFFFKAWVETGCSKVLQIFSHNSS